MRTRTNADSPASPSSESSKPEPEQDLDVDETSTISSISTKGPIDFSELPNAIEIHPQNANLSGSNNQQFIKRPLNAYMIWTVEQRQKIQKEPRQKMNEVSRAMGEVWKKMSQAEKAPYFAMAKKYAEEHKKALKENPNLAYVPSKKKVKLNKNDKEESMSMPSSPDISDSESPAPSAKPFIQPRSFPDNHYVRTSTHHMPSPLPRNDAFTYQTRRIPSVPPTAAAVVVESTPGQPYRAPMNGHHAPESTPIVHAAPAGPIIYSTAQTTAIQPQVNSNPVDPYAHSLNRQQLHERYYSSLVQYAFPSPFAAPSKIKQEPNYYYDLLIQSRFNNGYSNNPQFQL